MTVERVAVLSDIHGVLPALEAVLAEPAVRDADLVVLTGDLAAGPMPVPTLDLLEALGERAVWVRGNADRELVALAGGATETAIPDPVAPWAAAQLRPEQVARLAELPLTATVEVAGFGPVLFCHATPRDDEEVVLVDSRLARWADVFDGVAERTVVCGHTHMPYLRLVDRRLVVNPGSVGMPYGAAGAHWALLADGAVTRGVPASTWTQPAPGSPPRATTRTPPSGPTTTCAPGPRTRRRCACSARATAGPGRRNGWLRRMMITDSAWANACCHVPLSDHLGDTVQVAPDDYRSAV